MSAMDFAFGVGVGILSILLFILLERFKRAYMILNFIKKINRMVKK
jgi:hypothetical protein